MHRVRNPRRHHEPDVSMNTVTSTIDVRVSQTGVGLLSRVQLQMSVAPSSFTFWVEDFATEDFARASTDPTVPRCREAEDRQRRSQTPSVRGYQGFILHATALRFVTFCTADATSSSSMSSSSPSSCTSVCVPWNSGVHPAREVRTKALDGSPDETEPPRVTRDVPWLFPLLKEHLLCLLGVPGSLSSRSSGSGGCCARVASSGDWRAEGEFRSVKAGCRKQCRGGGPEGLF